MEGVPPGRGRESGAPWEVRAPLIVSPDAVALNYLFHEFFYVIVCFHFGHFLCAARAQMEMAPVAPLSFVSPATWGSKPRSLCTKNLCFQSPRTGEGLVTSRPAPNGVFTEFHFLPCTNLHTIRSTQSTFLPVSSVPSRSLLTVLYQHTPPLPLGSFILQIENSMPTLPTPWGRHQRVCACVPR